MSNHSDDIVTRLREIADADVYRTDISVGKLYEAADEIERLRNMLAHGLVFGSTCGGCLICKQLKEFHEQTLREIAFENQSDV